MRSVAAHSVARKRCVSRVPSTMPALHLQVTFVERERDLMRQLEAARQQRTAAEARGAAAVSHHSQEQVGMAVGVAGM